MKKVLYAIIAILLLAVIALYVTGNGHVINGIGKTYLIGKSKPDIDDREYFSVSTIEADHPEPWPLSSSYNLFSIPKADEGLIDSMKTTAFLVFKNDSLLFEKYWEDTNEETVSNSFSMAKSFTGILIGKAIDEGYIKSLDQPVGDFLPEFKEGMNASLTIKHLLEMSSGIPFGESYSSPLGYMAKAYYGKDLMKETLKYRVEKTPGSFWTYEGGNTVLLGAIIRQATGRTPSEYFFQKVWSCIGAEHAAYWNLDHEGGMEKTFSGFYATARDFGRLGKLFMHNGVWGNDTIVSPEFVSASLTPNLVPDEKGEACSWYGLHWWLGQHQGQSFFSCRRMRGQYIIGIPEAHLVIVRLGHLQNKERVSHMPPDLNRYIEIGKRIAIGN